MHTGNSCRYLCQTALRPQCCLVHYNAMIPLIWTHCVILHRQLSISVNGTTSSQSSCLYKPKIAHNPQTETLQFKIMWRWWRFVFVAQTGCAAVKQTHTQASMELILQVGLTKAQHNLTHHWARNLRFVKAHQL